MKKKVMASMIGTALAMTLYTGTTFALENTNTIYEGSMPVQQPINVLSFNVKDDSLKQEQMNDVLQEVQKSGLVPTSLEQLATVEQTVGVNPIYFPSTDLSKVVQEWKVVGEQYLRKDANLEAEVLQILQNDQKLEVLEETEDGWYKVKVKTEINVELEGKERKEIKEVEGFISSEYIQLLDEETKEEVTQKVETEVKKVKTVLLDDIKEEIKKEEEQKRLEEERKRQEELKRQEEIRKQKEQEEARKREAQREAQREANQPSGNAGGILGNANKYLGANYLYGASTSRTDAFDCSSFTKRVFQDVGINLPRNSAAQAGVGTTVSRSNLQPGDLVFFNTSGSGISHVGIYAGNGKFVGSQSSTGVAYADINSSYWSSRYVTAKRVH